MMTKTLKDELLEKGYEPATDYADWPNENKQIQPLVSEEGDHYVFVDREGKYVGEARYDE